MPFPSDTLLFSHFSNLIPLLFKLLPFHWLDGLLHSNAALLSTSTLFLTHVHPASFSAFHLIHSYIHSFIHSFMSIIHFLRLFKSCTLYITYVKGQLLRLHYEDFTTYIITLNWTPKPQECQSRGSNCVYTTRISPPLTLNWTPQPQECQSRDSNCVYTTRISPPLYSNFKLDTTTTGMSMKEEQLARISPPI